MTRLDALFDRQAARDPNVAAEAAMLLATWRRVESKHLPISFGCSCGMLGHVRAQDFEEDVLNYLAEKHAHAEAETALLQRYIGPENNRQGGIATLLEGLGDVRSPVDASHRLLADLRRSIFSWSNATLAATSLS